MKASTESELTLKSLVDPVMSPLSLLLITNILQDREILDRLYSTGYGMADLSYLKGDLKKKTTTTTKQIFQQAKIIKFHAP